jgi:uncharacterized protein (DUF433 family)
MRELTGASVNWRDRISVDPAVCHGQACIKGTRVLVSVLLDNVAAGESHAAIAAVYRISVEDVRAALAYASELAKEHTIDLRANVM